MARRARPSAAAPRRQPRARAMALSMKENCAKRGNDLRASCGGCRVRTAARAQSAERTYGCLTAGSATARRTAPGGDRAVQALRLGRRLDAEHNGQELAATPEGVERFGLIARRGKRP